MEPDAEKLKEILLYCYPHAEQMWAAKIIGIILECDFRDSKQEAKKFLEMTGDL